MGVETEFGCLIDDPDVRPEEAVSEIKDAAFYLLRFGLIDQHARDDVFEPSHSGGFLMNGGRLYIDAVGSHLEYATAECQSFRDVIAQDRAGHRLILRAIQEAGLEGKARVYNNAIDHFGGHTFGCHENYLTEMDEEFFAAKAPLLFSFLVTRQIYAGAGRVGGHQLVGGIAPDYDEMMENPVDFIWVSNIYQALPDTSVDFQLSQRADHILKGIAGRVRFNRALINPKWEHFYGHAGRQRLHLLFGEPNQSQFAYALKLGATHLAIRLVEDEAMPEGLQLAAPLIALREVSRDPSYAWEVEMADGTASTALEVQSRICEAAERYRGSSEETDWTLHAWRETLDALADDPLKLSDRLDWVAKRQLVDMYRQENDLEWSDDSLHSVDLEYHNINPAESLFEALPNMMSPLVSEADIAEAQAVPPQDTRAKGRGEKIGELIKEKYRGAYSVDWSGIMLGDGASLDFSDPHKPEGSQITRFDLDAPAEED